MNYLRHSIVSRWLAAWLFVSIALAGMTSLMLVYLHNDSLLGRDFPSQFLHILLYSAPWFLWGEILSNFLHKQKEYSSVRRIVSVLGLLLLLGAVVLWTGLLSIDS